MTCEVAEVGRQRVPQSLAVRIAQIRQPQRTPGQSPDVARTIGSREQIGDAVVGNISASDVSYQIGTWEAAGKRSVDRRARQESLFGARQYRGDFALALVVYCTGAQRRCKPSRGRRADDGNKNNRDVAAIVAANVHWIMLHQIALEPVLRQKTRSG